MRIYHRFLSLILPVSAILLILSCQSSPRIAYVDNSVLMEKTAIFAKARDSLKAFDGQWKQAAGHLKDSVDSYMKYMATRGQGLSKAEVRKLEEEFQARQQALTRYVAANQKKAVEIEKSLMEPALKRANAFIQSYRDKEGYSVIFGTTTGGNILAADKTLDITEKLIAAMNGELR